MGSYSDAGSPCGRVLGRKREATLLHKPRQGVTEPPSAGDGADCGRRFCGSQLRAGRWCSAEPGAFFRRDGSLFSAEGHGSLQHLWATRHYPLKHDAAVKKAPDGLNFGVCLQLPWQGQTKGYSPWARGPHPCSREKREMEGLSIFPYKNSSSVLEASRWQVGPGSSQQSGQ